MRAYTQGDLEPIMAVAAEDVVWDSNSASPHFRFGGRYNGHHGFKEALSLIASEFVIVHYDIKEITGEGDVLWALNDIEVLDRKTNRQVKIRLANRWEFRGDKIISCTEFFDSAGVLLQLGRTAEAA
ncbi:MAG TPA: nuclear transport factor 2 family protein [Rhizomicrobium sp.]